MVHVLRNRVVYHPGSLLLEQITEMGLTVNGVARDVGLPATRLHEIVHERRGISAQTAIALGVYFSHEVYAPPRITGAVGEAEDSSRLPLAAGNQAHVEQLPRSSCGDPAA